MAAAHALLILVGQRVRQAQIATCQETEGPKEIGTETETETDIGEMTTAQADRRLLDHQGHIALVTGAGIGMTRDTGADREHLLAASAVQAPGDAIATTTCLFQDELREMFRMCKSLSWMILTATS